MSETGRDKGVIFFGGFRSEESTINWLESLSLFLIKVPPPKFNTDFLRTQVWTDYGEPGKSLFINILNQERQKT